MLQSLRHRRLFLLRLLMLALVGFGVFGTSLASALTDIHMLSHADIGADVHEHDDAALAKAPDAEDAANALLHAPVQSAPLAQVPQCASQPAESLFRPPIAA
jgi:DMSO/TMAO reductase YedYZ molybdopterin-dependent catalytic subunit